MPGKGIDIQDVGVTVGSEFIGKGITRGLDYVDATYAPGKPLQERPGTYINPLGGLAAVLGGYYGLKKYPLIQKIAVVAGGFMLTKTTDFAEEAMAPSVGIAPGAAFVAVGPAFVAARQPNAAAVNAAPPGVAIRTPAPNGKYTSK